MIWEVQIMKKIYESPQIEIEKFTVFCDDVISDPGNGWGSGEDEFDIVF